ncbi:MAG: hypothetical protein R3F15_18405 [Lysobacterales bacterium]
MTQLHLVGVLVRVLAVLLVIVGLSNVSYVFVYDQVNRPAFPGGSNL